MRFSPPPSTRSGRGARDGEHETLERKTTIPVVLPRQDFKRDEKLDARRRRERGHRSSGRFWVLIR
jgi:hypothetical protein